MYLSRCKNTITLLLAIVTLLTLYSTPECIASADTFSDIQQTISNRECVIIVIRNANQEDPYHTIVNQQINNLQSQKFYDIIGGEDLSISQTTTTSKAGKALAKYYNFDEGNKNIYQILCFFRGALLDSYTINTKQQATKLYEMVETFYTFPQKNKIPQSSTTSCTIKKESKDECKGNKHLKKRTTHLNRRRNACKRAQIMYQKDHCTNYGPCGSCCGSQPCYSAPRFGVSFGVGGTPAWDWPGYYYNRPYWGGFGPWRTVPYWATSFNWSV